MSYVAVLQFLFSQLMLYTIDLRGKDTFKGRHLCKDCICLPSEKGSTLREKTLPTP